MVENFAAKLNEYAELLIKVGMNLQKGQTAIIRPSVDCAEFARMLVENAYKAGARDVIVEWSDTKMDRLRYMYAEDQVFDEVRDYTVAKYAYLESVRAATLGVSMPDPDAMLGVDPVRATRAQRALGAKIANYRKLQTSGGWQWCGACYVSPAWAKKVFPELAEDEAVDKLWDAVFSAVCVTGDGTSVEKWREKTAKGKARIAKLDEYNFKYLHYKNSIGTDVMVELPENHYWAGCAEKTDEGISFVPNVPTEEVFTVPKRDGVNGTLVSALPLNARGGTIENFRFVLKDGKIVEATAEKGEDILLSMLDTDEGARYLGEAALVAYDSPISNLGILFHNTLFDENVACHFAFGRCYPCVKGAEKLPAEEQLKLGMNQSLIHCDFMIGTPDLSITGIKADGTKIPVFVDGNFAF